MADDNGTDRNRGEEFASQAEQANAGLLREIWDLIRYNKKWWLLPVIIALLLIGIIVLLGSSAAAPFIYPLF
ncbi:MAG: DUF5989 family protein [Phycisphaerales bacterium JB039]